MSSKSEETSSIYISPMGKTKRTVGENTYRLLRLIWTYVAHSCLFILQVGRSDKDEQYNLKEYYRGITKYFSQFGLPLVIVSDNGPRFVSKEFEN